MKKAFLVGFGFFVLILWPRADAQTVIDNPAKPLNPKAGRVVTLKEELRIADTGEGYYFKSPYGIKAAPDGSIFVQDGHQQLLQFDPQGHFIRNFLKIGQGPGEMTQLMNFLLTPEHVIMFGGPLKILHMDYKGQVMKELGLPKGTMFRELLNYRNGTYYFYEDKRPRLEGGAKWMDVSQAIVAVSDEGNTVADLASFPSRRFVTVLPGGVTSQTLFSSLIIVLFGDTKYLLTHSPEYLAKLFDVDKKEVVCQFRRNYKRVKRPSGLTGGVRGPGGAGPEPPEYLNDITGLHVTGDQFFVQTSTVDKKNGILMDVFNSEGRYIDNFYLKYSNKDLEPRNPGKRLTFAGDYVFIAIKKCSLVGYR